MTVATKRSTSHDKSDPTNIPKFTDKEIVKKFVNPYTPVKGLRELTAMLLSLGMFWIDAVYLLQGYKPAYATYIIPCIFFGLLTVDFQSGVIHWVFDTYFSVRTPILGTLMLRPFRIHHVAPTAITFNYLLRSFGDNAILAIPQQIIPAWMIYYYREDNMLMYFTILWSLVHCFVGFCGNMIHRWAHTHGKPLPIAVKFLQDIGLFMSVKHHHKHHTPPFTSYHCIISGLCNYPLEAINFWRNAEWFIEKTTGTKPRLYPDLEE